MIETPAAAWQLEHIASKVDFLSIGGNDLAQFYFAADRETPAVSHRFDPLNPGFLGFVKMIIGKANDAKVPVGYCGEQIADPLMAAALVGLGIRHMSVPATTVGPMRRLVRLVHAGRLEEWFDDQLVSAKETLRQDLRTFLDMEGVRGF